jgi:hypothetical protein
MTRPVRNPNTELARLQASLAEQVAETRRQSRRNSKLYKEHQRLRRQSQRLRQELGEIENDKKSFAEVYDFIVKNVVAPYAKKMNLEFNDNDWDSLDLVLRHLYKDATKAISLRGHNQILQDQVKTQRSAIDDSQNELEKLRSQLKEFASQTQALQDIAFRAHVDTAHKEVRSSQMQLDASRSQVQTLRNQLQASRSQVQTLQNQLLAGVDKVNVYTDDQFSQDFRALTALIKTLSRSVRVAEHADVTSTLETCGLLKGVVGKHWDSRARIKSYIEAWLWSVLVNKVFSGPFSLFGHLGKNLDEDWVTVFDIRESLQWPEPSASCEKWRYTTMEHLVNMVGRHIITQGRADAATRSDASATAKYWIKDVVKNRDGVAQTIGEKLLLISSKVDVSRISHIIDKAFSLALQMSLQRSRIQVTFPSPGTDSVDGEMESMPDGNGNDMAKGRVAFIVNPGLTKWGDANGKKLEQRHNIMLPLVQLEESGIKREVCDF